MENYSYFKFFCPTSDFIGGAVMGNIDDVEASLPPVQHLSLVFRPHDLKAQTSKQMNKGRHIMLSVLGIIIRKRMKQTW